MAFESGIFTSTSVTVNGDGIPVGNKAVSAAFLASLFYHIKGDGISLNPTSAFNVAPVSGLTMRVSAGWGIKSGYPYAETTDYDITLNSSTSDQTLYVGVRLDVTAGEYTGNHVAARTTFVPATDQVYAVVVIPANAVTLTSAMITDVRRNPTYCGAVDEYDITLREMIATFFASGLPAHASTHSVGGADTTEIPSYTFTLDKDNWSDDEYELTTSDIADIANITADTLIEVLPSATSTAAEREAWRAALVVHGGQVAATSFTLLADGGAPTVDIPVIITFAGELV